MKVKIFVLLLSVTSASFAEESGISSPYATGGACSSQGIWTQNALSATQNLRRVTQQLRDDPNCKKLGSTLESAIQNLEASVKSASDTPDRVYRLSQIPRELNALRTFLEIAPDMKQQVLRLMMDKSIEGATNSAQVIKDYGDLNRVSSGLQDFGARLQQGTRTGLAMLNQTMDSLLNNDQCLMGDDQSLMGSFLGSAVQLLASFASSGQDLTGSQLATTISKFSNFAIQKRYSTVLRKLNQQEFMTSMSCLMEVTSESYCQARVGMGLFKKGMNDLKSERDRQINVKSGNPFVGYYVLNTHVPNITKWLQKIQIGVDPKLPTDAIFQNRIQQEVTDFYKGLKTLLGDYNADLLSIKSQSSEEAKKNAVLKLLVKITEAMVGGGFLGSGNGHTNFFTMSKNPLIVPFDLVGLPTVPDQVSGKTYPKLSYDEWFQANMDSLPIFSNPVALAETIGHNMQEIIRSANVSAIEYFNKWYIVDKAALVNESTIDINYTIPESLNAIFQYLESEKERIIQYNGDATNVPTIVDTQARIQKILSIYDEIEKTGKRVLSNPETMKNEADLLAAAELYEKLVNTVFEQFNVMQSRSGFLANRMVNFIYQDYVLLLKNKVDFTPYQQDLYTATGMAELGKMLQMYNGNPANIQTDLNMALTINKGNLEALDDLLKDSVIGKIKEFNHIINGKKVSALSYIKETIIDYFQDRTQDMSDIEKVVWVGLDPLQSTKHLVGSVFHWFSHANRYHFSDHGLMKSPESEFDNVESVKAQYCIQALAFYNQGPLKELCKGVVLKSPFADAPPEISVSYDQKVASYLNDPNLTPAKQQAWNHSDRICAFRDYNMRNMSHMMLRGKNPNAK